MTYLLHGHGVTLRFADTGAEALALVNFIMSKDCPLASAALTDADRATLLEIKKDAVDAAKKNEIRDVGHRNP